ncbi:MAG: hypothetical protein WA364_02730 [Candidatus Nitrosopolaris sp.]
MRSLFLHDLPKHQIRDRIRKEWEVDVEELESRGDIIIRTTKELYFPDGIPNIQRTMASWSTLVENCLSKGKRGIRGAISGSIGQSIAQVKDC